MVHFFTGIFLIVFALIGLHTSLAIMLLKRALAAYTQGRPQEAVTLAKQVLFLRPAASLRASAHHILGLGYSGQGLLDQAAQQYQEAYALGMKTKNMEQAARSLTLLGSLQRRQGWLAEAARTSEQAAQLHPKASRDALVGLGECLLAMGRIDEARSVFYQARATQPLSIPKYESRSQGAMAMGLAWIEGEANNPEAAWQYVQEAAAAFAGQPKLTLMADTTAAWILAMLQRREEALAKLQSVQTQAATIPNDRDTQLSVLTWSGQALLLLGDFAQAKTYFERYLAMPPDLVWQPRGWYYLGECCLGLDDPEGARNAFQKAVDLNLDTDYARRARVRLQQLQASPQPQV